MIIMFGKKIALCFLLSMVLFKSFSANSAIILSSCRAFPTDISRGSAPSVPLMSPQDRAPYVSSFDFFQDFMRTRFPDHPPILRENLSSYNDLLARIDDLRVYQQSQRHWSRAQAAEGGCLSTNQSIETFLAPFPPGSRREDLRVGYKICSFYRDANLEIGIEGTCRILGRPGGYSLQEISERFIRIDSTVRGFQTALQATILAGGVYGTLRLLRLNGGLSGLFRAGSVGAIAVRTSLVSIPTLAAAATLEYTSLTDFPIEHLINLRDAASLLYNGRRHQVIRIDQPIEDFELVLEDYLNTIP